MIRSLLLILVISCSGIPPQRPNPLTVEVGPNQPLVAGAQQLDKLLPKLESKRVALLVNHTAIVGTTHLADTLLKHKVNLVKIFVPEHGFRGTADAGEDIKDGVDTKTGLPLISLYGATKKPTSEQLADVEVVVFDIQDVGARFFTYGSTMHYMMEACAENNKKLIILDRPNPNGYVDGPVLQPQFKSFVGMHPVPVVHGLTMGELAQMINGEGWLGQNRKCDLEIITVKNWTHDDFYSLPVRPSPNLPDDQSIKLYPSTCLFEGTVLSVGRGTQTPFQVIGHPGLQGMPFQFTPVSINGMSKNPPYENQVCYGIDLRNVSVKRQIDLSYLIRMYRAFPDKENFFNNYFEKLAGNASLREQIKQGIDEAKIRESWHDELTKYNELRKKYLLYP
jgi:uncharacterized protein YbbC (DUF1343 family)